MELRAGSHHRRQSGREGLHWYTLLQIMTGASGALLAALAVFAPPGYGLPIFSTVTLTAGAALGIYAWMRSVRQFAGVSLWDVSGTLLFVGFFAGILSKQAFVVEMIAH